MDFIQFSYKGDEELSTLSVKSIIKNVKDIGSIVLLNDANNPISESTLKYLLNLVPDEKLFIINTNWNRNGNLIGEEHFFNYISILYKLKKENILKSNTIVKLDPDCIILKDNILNEFDKSEYLYGGNFADSEWYSLGSFYFFKNNIIDNLYKTIKYWGVFSDCEDVEFGHRTICTINNFDLRSHPIEIKTDKIKFVQKLNTERHKIAFTDFNVSRDYIYNREIEILSVGRINNKEKTQKTKERQIQCLKTMLEF